MIHATEPTLQEPVNDPARLKWHEVTKVAHYCLAVNAMTRPMQVREESLPYGKRCKFQGIAHAPPRTTSHENWGIIFKGDDV